MAVMKKTKVTTQRFRNRTLKKIILTSHLICVAVFIVYYYAPRSVPKINRDRHFKYQSKFSSFPNDSLVIVVQVHNRITYLRYLILSLSKARDISKTLLIFSHDFYDEEINELVQSIDFCKVVQIFYPFSIQTHPNEFPGTDPKDCKRDMTKEDALAIACKNAHYPDLYGHYREASYTQTKHHWWWKANHVFDQLQLTKDHTGLVLFLEEDHYVAEDFIYTLKLLQKLSIIFCSSCNVMSLGTYETVLHNKSYDKVRTSQWSSNKHNMGMAFNRSTWDEIKSCAKYFCVYDDYNWDWSLQYTSHQCMNKKLHVAFLQGPRIFHIGECGMHQAKEICELNELSKANHQLSNATAYFYPENLYFPPAPIRDMPDNSQANGGWSDLRDISLCLSMSIT